MNKYNLFNKIVEEKESRFNSNEEKNYYVISIPIKLIIDLDITTKNINHLVDLLSTNGEFVTVDYGEYEVIISVHRNINFREVKTFDNFIQKKD